MKDSGRMTERLVMNRDTNLDRKERESDSTPTVSVCIPSYNHAQYIGKCIESVMAQTLDDWELIIVDNCSYDNTREVVQAFKDPRMRFYPNDRNIGVPRNWNRCASLARGEYVAILQSDDQYLPRMLERSVATLDVSPRVSLVHSGFHRIDSEGNFIDTMRRWDKDRVMDGLTALRQLVTDCYITPSTVVMRRSSFNELGGFDERYRYNIDWSMWMRMALSSDIGYIAEPLVLQRTDHPASLTTRSLTREPHVSTSEQLHLIDEIFERLPLSSEWRDVRRDAYRYVMSRHIDHALWLLHHGENSLFGSEIAHAIRLNHRFPIQYRKMMVLWAASALGGGFGTWLDFQERAFWHDLRGNSITQPGVAP